MKSIILVCGLHGTGKSTLCSELAARIPSSFFLDADEFFTRKGGMPDDSDTVSEEERTMRRERYIAAKAAEIERLLALHDTIITDGLFTRVKDRSFVVDLAKKKGVQLVTIRLTCPEETVKKRIFAQQEHVVPPGKRWDAHLRTKESWEPVEGRHIEIDSSRDIDFSELLESVRRMD